MDELKKLSPEEIFEKRLEIVSIAYSTLATMLSAKTSDELEPFVLLVYDPKQRGVVMTGSTGKHGLLAFAIALLDELEEAKRIPAVEFPLAMLRIVQEVELAADCTATSTEPQATHSAPEGKQ